MILTVSLIDDAAKLEEINRRIAQLSWRDGRETAGNVARKVKHNQQADLSNPEGQVLAKDLIAAVQNHPVVKAVARPRRFSKPLVSRTRDGGHYGAHVDNAMMQVDGSAMRTDISFTLFLSSPDEYEGGELVVHSAGATSRIKGQQGELVLYPSSSIHEVTPVTAGERIACVGWIESLIPDLAQRELLFDLENLRTSLRQTLASSSAELLMLDKTIANLLRMWGRG